MILPQGPQQNEAWNGNQMVAVSVGLVRDSMEVQSQRTQNVGIENDAKEHV